MKKLILRDWLILLIIVAPFAILPFCWDSFPDSIPTHFNINGEPDHYSGKTFGLLLFPMINLIMYIILVAAPLIDVKRKNYLLFENKYRIIRLTLHVFMTLVFVSIILFTLGYKFDMTKVVLYGVVSLFLVLGNYMGNIRPNNLIGVRTPWTLTNEEVWRRTHRFTGKLWVASSLLMIFALLFIPPHIGWVVGFITLISVIPIVYSYIIYRTLQKV